METELEFLDRVWTSYELGKLVNIIGDRRKLLIDSQNTRKVTE